MILVAGIGNIFFGDDGFGCEAARRLAVRLRASDVRIVDFGVRGLDLAFALSEEYDAAILIDAVQRGGPPGSVYLIAPDLDEINSAAPFFETHGMDPMRVLAVARSMGARLKTIYLVGCEAETFGPPGEGLIGLSACVEGALTEAMDLVDRLIIRIRTQEAVV